METKEKNKNLLLGVLIGITVALIIAIVGMEIYKQYYVKDSNKNNNNNNNQTTETEEKVVLNEEDVKKWLSNNNSILELYYILEENDFDSNTASKEQYLGFLSISLMFGGLTSNATESVNLGYNGQYNYQYSYPISFIKDILKPLGVGTEVIDIDTMNKNSDIANFSMDSNKFTIKVVATGLDNYNTSEINKISLNDSNEIIVNYVLKDCLTSSMPGDCTNLGHRELVLKKTDDGYKLLKAYKVD